MMPPMSDVDEGGTTAPRAPEAEELSGIGAYVFERELGAGGMGTVYLARHRVRPGVFAVKLLKPSLATSHGLRQRFEREAKLGIDLHHPGIVDVIDFVVDGQRQALVMEYVPGETLLDRVRRLDRPLTWDEAEPVFRRLLAGLSYAHDQGVVHRDIKPGNVMMADEGGVKIMDFGIAHLEGVSGDSTRLVLGTLKYTAPELFDGSPPTLRADLYSLGMALFRVIAGRLPFPTGIDPGRLMELKRAELPAPSTFVATLPDIADRTIRSMTAPDPADRPENCRQVLATLDAAPGLDIEATPLLLTPRPELAGLTPPPPKPPDDDRARFGLGRLGPLLPSLALLALVALVLGLVFRGRSVHQEAPTDGPELVRAALQVEVAELADEAATHQTVEGERARPDPFTRPSPRIEPTNASPSAPRGDPVPGSLLGIQPKSGTLEVRAIPGAWVVIAGQRVGQAGPRGVNLELQPGEYKVRLVCDDRRLCASYERTSVVERATVSSGGYASIYVDFAALDPR